MGKKSRLKKERVPAIMQQYDVTAQQAREMVRGVKQKRREYENRKSPAKP